ncbi:helix-turn-helix domain-containing protein [Umboniibacter marinipuniceus]|uniref:Helix-turn-helix protein n=1 Tax=Umboniibacter marinipuniceus TaxID=569599 RepID=A0A3M0AUQ9_9GAMM|nr:helix-turn-helix domain-containing protein [Umboniibacter marinipuniceus]RMA82702.1 hypothetical protein DFR27_0659 [Umboniibacter marinipuniceus]
MNKKSDRAIVKHAINVYKARGNTQKDLAKFLDIPESRLSEYAKGKLNPPSMVTKAMIEECGAPSRECGWYMTGEIYEGLAELKDAVTTSKPVSNYELVIEGESIFRLKSYGCSAVRKLLPASYELGKRAFIEVNIFRTSSFKLATRVVIAPDESPGNHYIKNDFDFQSSQDEWSFEYISIPPEGSRVLVMEYEHESLFLDEFQSLCGWLGLQIPDSNQLKRQIAAAGGFLGGAKYIS